MKHKRVLAVDFELTCWEDAPPPGETAEIIQIGVAELDCETMERTRSHVWYVRPTLSAISAHCSRLTGIAAEDAKRLGLPLAEAGRQIAKRYGAPNKPWVAWGLDRLAHGRDCAVKGVPPFFSESYVDASLIYNQAFSPHRRASLADAAAALDVPFVGRAHDALSDAQTLREVYAAMLERLRGVSAR